MCEAIMKKNYVEAFRRIILLAVLLAVISAIAVPMSLSRQIRDITALEQSSEEQTIQSDGEHGKLHDREDLWKSQITPLTAANYAILGGLLVLWLALAAYYWLLVMAWLYKSAVNEGMNKSLWPILGLFFNFIAAFVFMIVRDRPARA